MEIIINAGNNDYERECEADCDDTCNCDPYTEGCQDEECMGEGESCIGDCRMGA